MRAQSLDRAGIGFTGTIASVDSFALIVRADNGKLVTFPIEEPFRVPEGLVPGTRITVRYEVVDRTRYRLVGVKIASAPMEHDSTTEPPALLPGSAPRTGGHPPGAGHLARSAGAAGGAGNARARKADAQADRGSGGCAGRAPARNGPGYLKAGARDVSRGSASPAPPAATTGSGEIATLVTLVLASGGLLWLALARV